MQGVVDEGMKRGGSWRWVGRGAGLLCLILLLGLGGGYLWLRTSLPQLDGVLAVPGLGAPVAVLRDPNAIPHIRAEAANDAYFALGFVHAQDRLWQMETSRRAGAGRLSEIFGERTIRHDRFMRTLGLYRLAERTFELLSAQARAAIEAYAKGVNAYLKTHQGALAPEYHLLRFDPEPWRPADSLVWGKLMAMRLARNWRDELLRARLSPRLGRARLDALWPPYPDGGPTTLASLGASLGASIGETAPTQKTTAEAPPDDLALEGAALDRLAAFLPPPEMPYGASNAWVVSGGYSASAKPILANDPHLGFRAPNIWYLARINAPGLNVAGATVPGMPFHIFGHNGRIAWGITNAGTDSEDLFAERLGGNDPGRYLTPGGSKPFALRDEVIGVRGGPDVRLRVRETRHGPILTDVIGVEQKAGEGDELLALAASALWPDDRSPEAFFLLNRARNWQQFVAALSHFSAPNQNFTYADIAGNIGFYSAGRVPIRKRGDGFSPVPGWSGEYDWSGFIPFAELPHAFNPPSGRLINANNKIAGRDYPYFLGRDWAPPYRARRIGELLARTKRHTPATMARIQGDVVSLAAREMLPLMLGAAQGKDRPPEGPAHAALGLLEKWDGTMDRGRPEPLIFSAWFRELNRLIYGDELGADLRAYWRPRPRFIKTIIEADRTWCDDIATAPTETCPERIGEALAGAVDDLSAAYGTDPIEWRWGDAHVARFRHGVLSRVPGLGALGNILIPTDGDNFTVNRGTSRVADAAAPFAQIHGPGLRAIYDLGNLENSLFIQATGQSGNPLSRHYRDLIGRWRDVEYVRLPRLPAGPEAGAAAKAVHRLTLMPR
jgi:penicillin amidase